MVSYASFVYVIGTFSSNVVKIGYTVNPVRRLAELHGRREGVDLQVLAMLPGARAEERQLHQRFAEQRLRGEWFDFGDADPVVAVTRAWLAIVQPATVRVTALDTPAAEMLATVRASFAEREDFLATTVLLARVMACPGWWQQRWNSQRAAQMGLSHVLSDFGIRHVRRKLDGVQQWGYMRQHVHSSVREVGSGVLRLDQAY